MRRLFRRFLSRLVGIVAKDVVDECFLELEGALASAGVDPGVARDVLARFHRGVLERVDSLLRAHGFGGLRVALASPRSR